MKTRMDSLTSSHQTALEHLREKAHADRDVISVMEAKRVSLEDQLKNLQGVDAALRSKREEVKALSHEASSLKLELNLLKSSATKTQRQSDEKQCQSDEKQRQSDEKQRQ